jgi:arginyl-tRNA synthetase
VTPDELSTAIRACLEAAVAAGDLTVSVPTEIRVERPRQREHGDWSTNIALQLAKPAGLKPRGVAELLAARLVDLPGIKSVDVAGPGFLNIVLDTASSAALVRTIVEAGAGYGHNQQLAGTVLNLEFVSANPTGPLHIGHTRWAALGDALARVLIASGAQVTREYYVNDAGAQMDRFGGSILARLRGTEIPEGGYKGEYVAELAVAVREQRPDVDTLPDDEALAVCREVGYAVQLAENRHTLSDFGVTFDVWFSERSLHESGAVEAAVARLREQGHVFDADGAVWLRTTDFGDDKDRVLIKADGEKTYFASDAAYWLSVRDRGFPKKIFMLGADHHGYVQRLRAIVACAGDDPDEAVEVLIGQLVSVGGARLSKRAGNIIELKDLVDWLGADAVRYSLARYPADSPLTLDGEVLRKKTNDNPVFYVQYAHARLCSLANQAAEHGVDRSVFDPALLEHPTENALIAALAQFPAIVVQSASLREPHRVARHLEVVAGAFHKWYDECRVTPRGEDPIEDVHRTRLWLAEASRLVLANGLDLLGVSAPERM